MFNTADTYIGSSNRLYHFTKAESLLSILSTMTIRSNSFHNSNDLFEEKVNVYMGNNCEQKKQLVDYIHNRCTYISFAIDKYDKDCSLSLRGAQLPNMWGNYADSNRGACIVIYKEKFEKANKSLLNSAWQRADEVRYKNIISPRTQIESVFSIEEFIKEQYEYLFFQKQKSWEHEQEYRYVFIDAPHSFLIKNCIEGIILGARFDKFEQLNSVLYDKNLSSYQQLIEKTYWGIQTQHDGLCDIDTTNPKIDRIINT